MKIFHFFVNGGGCDGFDRFQIKSFSEPVFFVPNAFVPNAFSPNNDVLNDQFVPLAFCDFNLTSFSVFNKWGQMVYRTTKENEGWNGYYDHKMADGGVYFWYIQGKDKTEKEFNGKEMFY